MKAHYNQTIKVITPFVIRERTLVLWAWRPCTRITYPSSVRRRPPLRFTFIASSEKSRHRIPTSDRVTQACRDAYDDYRVYSECPDRHSSPLRKPLPGAPNASIQKRALCQFIGIINIATTTGLAISRFSRSRSSARTAPIRLR